MFLFVLYIILTRELISLKLKGAITMSEQKKNNQQENQKQNNQNEKQNERKNSENQNAPKFN